MLNVFSADGGLGFGDWKSPWDNGSLGVDFRCESGYGWGVDVVGGVGCDVGFFTGFVNF
jgi:hypothetical protein